MPAADSDGRCRSGGANIALAGKKQEEVELQGLTGASSALKPITQEMSDWTGSATIMLCLPFGEGKGKERK